MSTELKTIQNDLQTDDKTSYDEQYNEARILINPVIVSREGLTEYWEACASVSSIA